MTNNEAIALLEGAADRADIMLEMAMLTPTTARAIAKLLKEQEAIKPTINEYGEAYCICGENVGIIPSNKNLPSVYMNYCPKCGRRIKWNESFNNDIER